MELDPRLIEVIAESLCVKTERVTNGATLEELGADSILYVDEIRQAVEDTFSIQLPSGTISIHATVGDLDVMIKRRAAERGEGESALVS